MVSFIFSYGFDFPSACRHVFAFDAVYAIDYVPVPYFVSEFILSFVRGFSFSVATHFARAAAFRALLLSIFTLFFLDLLLFVLRSRAFYHCYLCSGCCPCCSFYCFANISAVCLPTVSQAAFVCTNTTVLITGLVYAVTFFLAVFYAHFAAHI